LRTRPEKHTAHWFTPVCIRQAVAPWATLFLHWLPASVVWPHLPSISGLEFLVGPSCGTLGAGQVSLEGLDRVTVLFTDVILDMLFKDDDRVGILLGPTRRAFIRGLKPSEDALGVKNVFARQPPLRALGNLIKTDDTSLGKVGRAPTLRDRLVFALGAARRYRRAPCTHYEIEYLKFFREFPQVGRPP